MTENTWIPRISVKKQQEQTRTVLTGSVKGRNVTSRLIESGPFDLPSRQSKNQRGVFQPPDPVLHHHGSQHTATVSPHLVCLLRQVRGCCGPIRSIKDPHGAHVLYSTKHTSMSYMEYTVPNTRQWATWIIQYPVHVQKLHELCSAKHTLRRHMDYTVPNTR